MEKERIFRERFVQQKASQGSDAVIRQRKSIGGGTATAEQLDIENFPSPPFTN